MTTSSSNQDHSDKIEAARGLDESVGSTRLTDPLRNPRSGGAVTRTKRAWLLLLLTTLIPGSAQLVAGHRRLGRIGLTVTLSVWALIILLFLVYLIHRAWVIDLVTGSFMSLVLVIVLIALALFWALLFVDTLRLIRPVLLAKGMRPAVIIGFVVLLFVTAGGVGYTAYLVGVGRGAVSNIFASGDKVKPVDGRYNFLLMGGDAGSDRVGRRPDSMTVFSVDAKTGQAVTISLPRNTQNAQFSKDSPLWKIYPDGYNCGDECILNALYPDVANNHKDLYPNASDPGAEAMKDAAEGITGLPIQAYVLVDMDGFANLIDSMGGIDINVGGRVPIGGGHDEITGAPNPIDGYIEPGRQHLDGFHALWYGRSREGASDYDREARQRCVQSAMLKQLDPATVLTRFQDISNAGQKIIETDIPEKQLSTFVDLGIQSKDHSLIQYGMAPPYFPDTFPTYPDFDQFHSSVAKVIQDSKDGKTPDTNDGSSPQAAGSGTGVAPVSAVSPMSLLQPLGVTAAQQSSTHGASSTVDVQLAAELTENGTCSVP
ncbi:LCP family protein [Kocuria massiliensis]|uniref:LCP family glycopolymer transferase n=1 Tax=Kocuria massiliensis TaxID=1926282 RepID=UPI0022B9C342|nr:LCP family protein [Kocuria massiliensis]